MKFLEGSANANDDAKPMKLEKGVVLVTGGAGFIGSSLVRTLLGKTSHTVITVDKLTYAGNMRSLAEVMGDPRHVFKQVDVCDADALTAVFSEYQPSAVMHLAAESHVDRSIIGPAAFIQTNIVGTYQLLEAARRHWETLGSRDRESFRFQHISTDEVFGSLGPNGAFNEETPYRPNSPYSASKASSDHLVRAWHHTYELPVLITNCSNNYGPRQFPEKLIPLMILNTLQGKDLPVYGNGSNIRDWLYVEDHSEALLTVLQNGRVGETYNIGGDNEMSNLDLVRSVCKLMDELRPDTAPNESRIRFVKDRPGHDWRYRIDTSKMRREFGWRPRESFETGLRKTVEWYLENHEWTESVLSGEYRNWIETNYERVR